MDHRNISRGGEKGEAGQPPDALPPDDAALLRRYAQARDEAAFAELVRRHLDGVYAAALRRVGGDAHLAQDVAQQVFAALARQAPRLAPGPGLTGWLYGTTRNAAGSLVRAERRRKAREQEAHAMEKLLSPAAADLPPDWGRVAPVLDSALDELREAERQVVLWRFVDRRPFAEIGAALRVTEDAARMRVDRALEKLRAGLARRGLDSTSAALGVALAQNIAAAAPASLLPLVTQTALVVVPAAAGGSVLFLLQTMAQAKLTTAVVAGAALLAGGSAVYQGARHHAAATRLDAAIQAHAAVVVREREIAMRIRSLDAEADRLGRAATPGLPAATGGPPDGDSTGWNPAVEGEAFLRRFPEVRQAMFDAQRAEIEAEYGPFFRAQGLTARQIADFTAVRAASYRIAQQPLGAEGKMYELALGNGYGSDDMERILGEDAYRKLEDFENDTNVRWVTSTLANAIAFSATPLASAQASRLAEIVSRHRPTDTIEVETFDWPAIFGEAAAVLQPVQLSALRRLLAEESAYRAAAHEGRHGHP